MVWGRREPGGQYRLIKLIKAEWKVNNSFVALAKSLTQKKILLVENFEVSQMKRESLQFLMITQSRGALITQRIKMS